MKKRYTFILLILIVLLGLNTCERNQDRILNSSWKEKNQYQINCYEKIQFDRGYFVRISSGVSELIGSYSILKGNEYIFDFRLIKEKYRIIRDRNKLILIDKENHWCIYKKEKTN